jgi:hypothetical protein
MKSSPMSRAGVQQLAGATSDSKYSQRKLKWLRVEVMGSFKNVDFSCYVKIMSLGGDARIKGLAVFGERPA